MAESAVSCLSNVLFADYVGAYGAISLTIVDMFLVHLGSMNDMVYI